MHVLFDIHILTPTLRRRVNKRETNNPVGYWNSMLAACWIESRWVFCFHCRYDSNRNNPPFEVHLSTPTGKRMRNGGDRVKDDSILPFRCACLDGRRDGVKCENEKSNPKWFLENMQCIHAPSRRSARNPKSHINIYHLISSRAQRTAHTSSNGSAFEA